MGTSDPAMIRNVVVLPLPLGPISEMNSPSSTARLRSFTATPSPKRLVTPASSEVGAVRVRTSNSMKGPVRRSEVRRHPSSSSGGVPMRAKPWVVPDGLWERIEPLLPARQRRFRYPGRRRLDDRQALQGILFVLHTGIAWEHLPQELGFGCGMTAGGGCVPGSRPASGSGCTSCCSPSCTPQVELEWSRAVADSSHVQAKKGAPRRARARSIAAGRAPSTTCSSTAAGSRSPGRSPAATATTSPS